MSNFCRKAFIPRRGEIIRERHQPFILCTPLRCLFRGSRSQERRCSPAYFRGWGDDTDLRATAPTKVISSLEPFFRGLVTTQTNAFSLTILYGPNCHFHTTGSGNRAFSVPSTRFDPRKIFCIREMITSTII